MIVPSIDIQDGQAVQLVGGRDRELEAGDPIAIAERFAVVGEIAVVDLDAAMGRGDNRPVIRELVRRYPCRVGGGIRSVDAALAWLDEGARSVVLGTAARPDVLERLPRERVIAALDAIEGEVVVEGWRTKTGGTIDEGIHALRDAVGGFLVTFVEREGRLGGTDMDAAQRIVAAAGDARVTIAGGVTTTDEIAALDRLGADAQIGMALYKGSLDLADGFAAPLVSDRSDGLWATVVCDASGRALGLAWSDADSLRRAIRERRGIYRSRSRGVWVKGETSGNHQELLRVDADCDRDALRFTVRQHGAGFCHNDTWTCWGADDGLRRLERTLSARLAEGDEGSYTRRLVSDPALLAKKLIEEAEELAAASSRADVVDEAADVVYFTAVALARAGASLDDVARVLDRRALRLRRRSQSPGEKSASERGPGSSSRRDPS